MAPGPNCSYLRALMKALLHAGRARRWHGSIIVQNCHNGPVLYSNKPTNQTFESQSNPYHQLTSSTYIISLTHKQIHIIRYKFTKHWNAHRIPISDSNHITIAFPTEITMARPKILSKGYSERFGKVARRLHRLKIQAEKDATTAKHLVAKALRLPGTTKLDRRFHGDVIMRPKTMSVQAAREASKAPFNPRERVFFASWVAITKNAADTRGESTGRKHVWRNTGGALTYRPSLQDGGLHSEINKRA